MGSRFIDQVDGLIRQEPIGNIAYGKLYCCNDGLIPDPDLVIVLIFLFDSPRMDMASSSPGSSI